MLWIFVALTAVIVVVIALVAVGRVTFTLAEQPRPSSYELEEAVEYVADELPDDVTAQVSYDDVRAVLGLHLDYLEVKGVAFETGTVEERAEPDEEKDPNDEVAGDEVEAPDAPRSFVFPDWPEASPQGPLVADDDEALPYILGRLADLGREIDDVHVVEVLHAERRYLEAIGAIGAAVPSPTDPTDVPDATAPDVPR